MKNVTIIFAHPFYHNSVANKTIMEHVRREHPDFEVRNLCELYPDFKIDAKKEQTALLHSDIVVLQFPMFWYNVPAIIKQWFDTVLEHGFAYGTDGDKLKGKHFILSFTTGGDREAYSPLGYNHFRIDEFLKMFEQTSYLTQMIYEDPVYSLGMMSFGDKEIVEKVKIRSIDHAKRLTHAIDKIE